VCCDERGVGVRGPPRAPVASGARCRGSCKRLGRASGIRPLWVPGSMLQAGGTRGQRRLRVRGIRRRHRLIGYVDRGLPEDASLSWRSDRSVCSSNQHLPNLYCRARRECRDFRHGRENPRSFKGAIQWCGPTPRPELLRHPHDQIARHPHDQIAGPPAAPLLVILGRDIELAPTTMRLCPYVAR
jgi:hypothetical protein